MSSWSPAIFPLVNGVDTYNPPISSEELKFLYLDNLEPRLGRLYASLGHTLVQSLGNNQVVSFGMYHLSNRLGSQFYAFTATKVYWYDIAAGTFNTTPIYSGFASSTDPYVILPWYDCLYVTKKGQPLVRLQYKTATVITGGINARYGVIANGHAYLGGAGDSISNQLARIRWSDLDDPESWEINTNESESDFFDLEPEERQITGISYQRGRTLVYSEDSIWAGTYIGFPGGFRHEPLFPGIGNIFHHSVIRAKEIDYFIGKDNIYALNGLQLIPIGDEIFERFINDVTITSDTVVQGYLNTRKSQVFWVYSSSSRSGTMWEIVFNYKENKWSERSAQKVSAFFDSPRTIIRGYTAIDEIATDIDDVATMIDALEAITRTIPQLCCSNSAPSVYDICSFETTQTPYISSTECLLETFDFYVDDFMKFKEVMKVVFELTKSGSPTPYFYVGTRKNLTASVTWSSAIAVSSLESAESFFVRAEGVGRYIRFRLRFENSGNYISQLHLMSVTTVADNQDVNATQ